MGREVKAGTPYVGETAHAMAQSVEIHRVFTERPKVLLGPHFVLELLRPLRQQREMALFTLILLALLSRSSRPLGPSVLCVTGQKADSPFLSIAPHLHGPQPILKPES